MEYNNCVSKFVKILQEMEKRKPLDQCIDLDSELDTILVILKHEIQKKWFLIFVERDSQCKRSEMKVVFKTASLIKVAMMDLCKLINNYCATPEVLSRPTLSLAIMMYFCSTTRDESAQLIAMLFGHHASVHAFIFGEMKKMISKFSEFHALKEHHENIAKLYFLLLESGPAVVPLQDNEACEMRLKSKMGESKVFGLYFLYELLQLFGKRNKEDNTKNCYEEFMKNFVTAVLKHSVNPDYPAAKETINYLIQTLVVTVKNEKTLSSRLLAMDFLKDIAIHTHSNANLIPQLDCQIDNILEKYEASVRMKTSNKVENCRELLTCHLAKAHSNERFTSPVNYYIGMFICDNERSRDDDKENVQQPRKPKKKVARMVTTIGNTNLQTQSYFEVAISYCNSKHILQLTDGELQTLWKYVASCDKPLIYQPSYFFRYIFEQASNSETSIRCKVAKYTSAVLDQAYNILSGNVTVPRVAKALIVDHSVSVRDAGIDVIASILNNNANDFKTYQSILFGRLLDINAGIRKKIVQLLGDFCLKNPKHESRLHIIQELTKKLFDQVTQIVDLIVKFFHELWFDSSEKEQLKRNFSELLLLAKHNQTHSQKLLEMLLVSNRSGSKTFKELITHLLGHLFATLGTNQDDVPHMLFICSVISRYRPEIVLKYKDQLIDQLRLGEAEPKTTRTVTLLAILTELVPAMSDKRDIKTVEELVTKYIYSSSMSIIIQAVKCLASVAKKTNDYSHVSKLCESHLDKLIDLHRRYTETADDSESLVSVGENILKCLCILAVHIDLFNFSDANLFPAFHSRKASRDNITSVVFRHALYWMDHLKQKPMELIYLFGVVCVEDRSLLDCEELKNLYKGVLQGEEWNNNVKIHVLRNLTNFLHGRKKIPAQQSKKVAKSRKLNDINTSFEESVISVVKEYLQITFEVYFTTDVKLRNAAAQFLTSATKNGLLYPEMVIPYLVCMSAEKNVGFQTTARNELALLSQKYPKFLSSSLLHALRLTFRLQTLLQQPGMIVRGFERIQDANGFKLKPALHFAFSLLSSSSGFVTTLLNALGCEQKMPLPQLLFYADHLAYFEFKEDLLMKTIKQITSKIFIAATTLLNSYKQIEKSILKKAAKGGENRPNKRKRKQTLLDNFPSNSTELNEWIYQSTVCTLLVDLRKHLIVSYSVSEKKLRDHASGVKVEKTKLSMKSVLFEPNEILTVVENGGKNNSNIVANLFSKMKNITESLEVSDNDSQSP